MEQSGWAMQPTDEPNPNSGCPILWSDPCCFFFLNRLGWNWQEVSLPFDTQVVGDFSINMICTWWVEARRWLKMNRKVLQRGSGPSYSCSQLLWRGQRRGCAACGWNSDTPLSGFKDFRGGKGPQSQDPVTPARGVMTQEAEKQIP